MGRFQDPYYAAHVLLLASYSLLHMHCKQNGGMLQGYSRFSKPHELAVWEQQATLTMVAILGWKWLWRRSLDHWLDQAFFYGKVVLAFTAAQVDVRIFVWYCIILLVFYAIFPQPMIDFKDSDHMQPLTGQSLKSEVLQGEGTWLVYFYAEGHAPSIAMAPAIVEVAEKFAEDGTINFGYFDTMLWPGALKDLKLTSNTWSNQLPAAVVFEKGKEVARLPSLATAEQQARRNYFTKKDVIKALQSRPSNKGSSSALASRGKAASKKGK